MRIEGEALVEPKSGQWYWIIRIIKDDGTTEDAVKTKPIYPTKQEAERAVFNKIREVMN